MLRAVLLFVGVVTLAVALLGAFLGVMTIPLAVFGAILVLALLFERYVYKPIREEPPGQGWDRTEERFADPGSGQNVVVYFNRRTGERRYVAERNG